MEIQAQGSNEVVDLQEYAKAGREVPRGRKYRFKVDRESYETQKESVTGREILVIAGKAPESHLLRQKIGSRVEDVDPDEIVSLLKQGVERFMTIPKEVTEGEVALGRRDFTLLEEDREYLDGLGLVWESVLDGQARRIIIHGWAIPQGYNVQTASVSVHLAPGYPDTQIDMAYFHPHLARSDGKGIGALSPCAFDGTTWQQWSRHRTSASTWRMGEDNLETHMALVANWLRAELLK